MEFHQKKSLVRAILKGKVDTAFGPDLSFDMADRIERFEKAINLELAEAKRNIHALAIETDNQHNSMRELCDKVAESLPLWARPVFFAFRDDRNVDIDIRLRQFLYQSPHLILSDLPPEQ